MLCRCCCHMPCLVTWVCRSDETRRSRFQAGFRGFRRVRMSSWEEVLRLLERVLQERTLFEAQMDSWAAGTVDAPVHSTATPLQGACPEQRLSRCGDSWSESREACGKLQLSVYDGTASQARVLLLPPPRAALSVDHHPGSPSFASHLCRALQTAGRQLTELTADVSGALGSTAGGLMPVARRLLQACRFICACRQLAFQAWALDARPEGTVQQRRANSSGSSARRRAVLAFASPALGLLMGPGRAIVQQCTRMGDTAAAELPILLAGQLIAADTILFLLAQPCWRHVDVAAAARSGAAQAIQLLVAVAEALQRVDQCLRGSALGVSCSYCSRGGGGLQGERPACGMPVCSSLCGAPRPTLACQLLAYAPCVLTLPRSMPPFLTPSPKPPPQPAQPFMPRWLISRSAASAPAGSGRQREQPPLTLRLRIRSFLAFCFLWTGCWKASRRSRQQRAAQRMQQEPAMPAGS